MLNPSIATKHNRFAKLLAALMVAGLFIGSLTAHQASAAPASTSQLFSATGHTVSGSFLAAYYRLGGLPIIGYPITEPVIENGYQVQYFERERFEYHPENAGTPYEVLLSRLGYDLSKPLQPFAAGQPGGDGVFFAQTNHSLSGEFLRYWNGKGGLSLFGYPISEQFTENGIITQYFERARFEYHPEALASTGYAVELGLLGDAYLQQSQGGASTAPQAPAAAQVHLNQDEQQLLNNINSARQAAGLDKLDLDTQVEQLAHDRVNDMANRNYFSHITPEGTTFVDMMNQRNIAYNNSGEIINRNTYPNAPQEAFTSFMASQHHHDIIMTSAFNFAGVAEATGAGGMKYFVVIFVAR